MDYLGLVLGISIVVTTLFPSSFGYFLASIHKGYLKAMENQNKTD